MPLYTICFSLYSSLVSVTPVQSACVLGYTPADIAAVTDGCKALDHDPLTTCETRRAGALKYFVTIRQLETK